MSPSSSFTTRRRIEFADTDMGGIVHFSRYFIFMETAEHQFLESLGISEAAIDRLSRVSFRLLGLISFTRLPFQLSPTVIEPEIKVTTTWRGALATSARSTGHSRRAPPSGAPGTVAPPRHTTPSRSIAQAVR